MNALIVTLELDPDLARQLTAWRTRYFPADRNYLDAHVTLFHALPASTIDRVQKDLGRVAAAQAAFSVTVPTVYSLGRGVALEIVAPEIQRLRSELRAAWVDELTPQDRAERIRPHVTVQNKVGGDEAKRTLAEISATWDRATTGTARGFGLWEYLGGPWRHAASFDFARGD